MSVPDDLADDLEIACIDALRGDPPGPAVATRLQRACIDVLRRRGLEGARVHARSDGSGTAVRIIMPSDGPKVREIVLRLG